MSAGNVNSYGDKKNNFPFQLALLQALGENKEVLTAILAALGGSTSDAAVGPIRATGPGAVPANFKSVSFYNAHATVNSTVNGGTLKPGESVSFSGSMFPAGMTYDGTGSELVVTYVI